MTTEVTATNTLEVAMVKIIEKTMEGIDSSVTFLQAELPDVITQLLTYNLVESFILTFICFCFLASGGYLLFKFLMGFAEYMKTGKGNFYIDKNGILNDSSIFMLVYVFFSFFFGGIGFIINGTETLKLWLAPKVWLIEYAADLARRLT